jgi:hypothetical protein
MKRWILLAVLAVVLSTIATVIVQNMGESASPLGPGYPVSDKASGRHAGPRPKAVVDGDPTYHFGTLPQRATSKHTWAVHNQGDADLTLWMISSTCSCTLAKFKNGEKALVKPGETTEIDLEFETRENNGAYEKGAEIGTNDPELPQFSLHVKGQVFPAVMTTAPSNTVNFSGISNDQDDIHSFVAVFSRDRPETKILKAVSSRPDDVGVEFEPLNATEAKQIGDLKGGYRVTIRPKPSLPLGNFREEIIVTTDHPKQPEVRIGVTGSMSGPINVIPARLLLHQVSGRDGGQGTVVLAVRNARETKFEVEKAPKGVKVSIEPGEGGARKGRYRLLIEIPPGTPAQEIEDEIKLKTDHPKAGTVFVPISIWVQNS